MITYSVTFRPGRYKYVTAAEMGMPQNPLMKLHGKQAFIIGREDDGATVAFCFEEEEAKHICLGLNLLDAYITGNSAEQKTILAQFERLKKQ